MANLLKVNSISARETSNGALGVFGTNFCYYFSLKFQALLPVKLYQFISWNIYREIYIVRVQLSGKLSLKFCFHFKTCKKFNLCFQRKIFIWIYYVQYPELTYLVQIPSLCRNHAIPLYCKWISWFWCDRNIRFK